MLRSSRAQRNWARRSSTPAQEPRSRARPRRPVQALKRPEKKFTKGPPSSATRRKKLRPAVGKAVDKTGEKVKEIEQKVADKAKSLGETIKEEAKILKDKVSKDGPKPGDADKKD